MKNIFHFRADLTVYKTIKLKPVKILNCSVNKWTKCLLFLKTIQLQAHSKKIEKKIKCVYIITISALINAGVSGYAL